MGFGGGLRPAVQLRAVAQFARVFRVCNLPNALPGAKTTAEKIYFAFFFQHF